MSKIKVINKHALAALVPGTQFNSQTDISVSTNPEAATVIFNVGGVIYETYRSTLFRNSGTNLSDELFMEKFYRKKYDDYFFDHEPSVFLSVLEYHRTGQLHLPNNVCGPIIKRELEFWGVSESIIERCCWNNYDSWNSSNEAIEQLEKDRKKMFVAYEDIGDDMSRWRRIKVNLWDFLTNPDSSLGAKIYGFISIMIVLISIASFILETHPDFKVLGNKDFLGRYYQDTIPIMDENNTDTGEKQNLMPHSAIVVVDVICLVFFTIELAMRFICSPKKKPFVLNFLNIVDFISLAPDYIELILMNYTSADTAINLVQYISILRIMRVFRIFRLVRHISGLFILLYTLKASFGELLLMCVFMVVGMLLYATLIYYFEEKNFPNIPMSLWWALITMTTVGYGDMYPEEKLGYLVGSFCAITGLLMVGFTVPILVNNFVLYYTHIQSATRAEEREKKAAKEKKYINKLLDEEYRHSMVLENKKASCRSLDDSTDNIGSGDRNRSDKRPKETMAFYQKEKDVVKCVFSAPPPSYDGLEDLRTNQDNTSLNSRRHYSMRQRLSSVVAEVERSTAAIMHDAIPPTAKTMKSSASNGHADNSSKELDKDTYNSKNEILKMKF